MNGIPVTGGAGQDTPQRSVTTATNQNQPEMTMATNFATHSQLHMQNESPSPVWMKWMLIAAGIYNLGFGVFAILFPGLMFDLIAMDQPKYPELWQCIGMIVGVYGVGYIIAAFDPARHWPIVLVGFLGKLFGPIGMVIAVSRGTLPIEFGLANVTNDLIWLVPFGLVLLFAYRRSISFSKRVEK